MSTWLDVSQGDAPLVVSFPHTGTDLPVEVAPDLVSPWLARKDADWWVDELYALARDLGATTVRTSISRTVIDCNRDPSGASLYPGQATTDLCPVTTFDGEPLYHAGRMPDPGEIARRREHYFDPYHGALAAELGRLREAHGCVVLYDAHSIRSRIPRLFDGELPHFNIGTNGGATCAAALSDAVAKVCGESTFSHVVNGRFRGGWTTRHYGDPAQGVHAIQMELAMRAYLDEPRGSVTADNWPKPFDHERVAAVQQVLQKVLQACLGFARTSQH